MEIDSITYMPGTDLGSKYVAFARKDGILLGFKPYTIRSENLKGVGRVVAVVLRLRSARDQSVDEATETVVSLAAHKATPGTVWPGLEWEKEDDTRASSFVILRLPFDLDVPSKLKQFLAEYGDGKLAVKAAAYFLSLIPEGTAIVTQEELAGWLSKHYSPFFDQLAATVQVVEVLTEEATASLGSFTLQASSLKKAYDKIEASKAADVEDLPAEDPTDEATTGDHGPEDTDSPDDANYIG